MTSRAGWLALAGIATAFFTLPVLWLWPAHFDYLALAHESLAYRYFFNIRVLDGQGIGIWTAQGQLLSTIQHPIVLALHYLGGLSYFELQPILRWYSLLTNLVVSALFLAVAVAAGLSPRLNWLDRCLILISGPFIVMSMGYAGFFYRVAPDYYSLDIVIVSASVFFALDEIRGRRLFNWRAMILAGVFCGLAASNKITMAGPAGLVVLLVAARPAVRLGSFVGRCSIAAFAAIIAALFVFWASYLFDARATVQGFKYVYAFAKITVDEGMFWDKTFQEHLSIYNYGIVIAIWIAATLVFAYRVAVKRAWISRAAILLAGCIWVAGMLWYGLLKRGAGTSFFELCAALVGLAAIALAMGVDARRQRIAGAVVAAAALLPLVQFDYRNNWAVARALGVQSETAWQVFDHTRQLKGDATFLILDPAYYWSVEKLVDIGLDISGDKWRLTTPLAQLDTGSADPPFAKMLRMKKRFLGDATVSYTWSDGLTAAPILVWYEKRDEATNRPLRETDPKEQERWRGVDQWKARSHPSCRHWPVAQMIATVCARQP